MIAYAYGLVLILGIAFHVAQETGAIPAGSSDATCQEMSPLEIAEKPAVSKCLQRLGLAKEDLATLIKPETDDKCLAKCILMEHEEINENGEVIMENVEAAVKKHVPAENQDKALVNIKACFEKSGDILKEPGTDKSTAVCKFASATLQCFAQKHEKMCDQTQGS